MSRLTIVDERLRLRFSRAEQVMGILRDLDVPLDRVGSADPLRESWWRAVRGWRLGPSLPRVRLVGTWRHAGGACLAGDRDLTTHPGPRLWAARGGSRTRQP